MPGEENVQQGASGETNVNPRVEGDTDERLAGASVYAGFPTTYCVLGVQRRERTTVSGWSGSCLCWRHCCPGWGGGEADKQSKQLECCW